MRKVIILLFLFLVSTPIISAPHFNNDRTCENRYYPSAADTSIKRDKTSVKYRENQFPSLTPSHSVPISTKTNYDPHPSAGSNYEAAKREFMKQSGYPNGRPGYKVVYIKPLNKGGCTCAKNMKWKITVDLNAKDK